MRVGIREFQSRAAELVRRAEAGEEVTITRRSRPVAVLRPEKPTDAQTEEEIVELAIFNSDSIFSLRDAKTPKLYRARLSFA